MRDRYRLMAAALTVAAAGCGVLSGSGEPIVGASLTGDGRVLVVEHVGCAGELDADVEEQADAVVVTLPADDASCDAVQGTTVRLDASLGDRRLVDGTTGEAVTVGRGDG